MDKLLIFTDGGARGNPGPAAIGVVIKLKTKNLTPNTEEEKIIAKFGKKIGETTNNVAEYTAVIEALIWIKNNSTRRDQRSLLPLRGIEQFNNSTLSFYLDSKLVVNQLNGLFKVRDARLREHLSIIRELEAEIGGNISYQRIPRNENHLADSLVNQALDS